MPIAMASSMRSELRAIGQRPPDAEMTVDLKSAASEAGLMRLDGTAGQRLDDAVRCRLRQSGVWAGDDYVFAPQSGSAGRGA